MNGDPNPINLRHCTCGDSISGSASHRSPQADQDRSLKASKPHMYFDQVPDIVTDESRKIEAHTESQNMAKAPAQLLPGDLMGEIFTYLCKPGENRLDKSRLVTPALNVSHVCSLWRAVAQESPWIWSDITIELYRTHTDSLYERQRPEAIPLTLSHYLTLSGSRPLSIHLFYPPSPPHTYIHADIFGDQDLDILATISPHSHRIVSLTAPLQAMRWWVRPDSYPVPLPGRPTYSFHHGDEPQVDLASLDPNTLPSDVPSLTRPFAPFEVPNLKKLSVPYTRDRMSFADNANLFKNSKQLTEIHCSQELFYLILSGPTPSVTKLATTDAGPRCSETILKLCPNLQYLAVRGHERRSTFPITTLPVTLPFVRTLVVDLSVVLDAGQRQFFDLLRLPSLSSIDVSCSSCPRNVPGVYGHFVLEQNFTVVSEHPNALLELIWRSDSLMSADDIRYDGLSLEEMQKKPRELEHPPRPERHGFKFPRVTILVNGQPLV